MRNSPSDLDEGLKQRGLARTNRGFQCSQSFKDLSKEGFSPITYYRMGVWGGMRTYQSSGQTHSATRVIIRKRIGSLRKI